MDFWRAILGLARQKLVVIPLLLSAVVLASTGYFLTPLRYFSSATMVLVTPAFGGTLSQDPTVQAGLTNPMLSFGNELKTAAAILIYATNTPEAAAALGAVKGGPTKVTIDDGRTSPDILDNNGPFVYVAAESTSKTEAKEVVERAQKRIRQELIDRQRSLGAPPDTFLTMVDVVPATTAEVTRAQRIKISGIAFVMSLVFGMSIAYGWQHIRASRPRRAMGGLPPEHQENELDSSREKLHENPDRATEERSADRPARTADTGLADGEQRTEDGEQDLGVRGNAEPQSAGTEHAADAEQRREANADEDLSEAERQSEPEQVVYASEDEQLRLQDDETKELWDLYIAEYPPGDGGLMRSPERRIGLEPGLECGQR